MPVGLDAATTARLIARHGTLDAAAQKARADPRFEAAFREAIAMQWLPRRHGGGNAAATVEFWQLVAAWDRLDDEAGGRRQGRNHPAGARVRQPAATPHALVERALRLKAAGLGRRKIAQAVPELADWEAQRIVYYHGKGEPEGLWLDAEDRMRWGPAISSTPAGLILPNPWKPAS